MPEPLPALPSSMPPDPEDMNVSAKVIKKSRVKFIYIGNKQVYSGKGKKKKEQYNII